MKFYYNLLSQPSRALYIFLKQNNIPAEFIDINLINGDHMTDEFKEINRFQKVPCIVDDDGWKLAESIAILR
jgi:glutathione S-transferase